MYSVFVRNFSQEGTFAGLQRDLDRIKNLGVDIIWLMPIHPIGEKARKGSLGSPYANKDYREVNPEFGTKADLEALVEAIHKRGMKCIIDVVYNHTSPDSTLAAEHPEWFYHKPNGSFGNRVGDWTDIIDLDYNNKELWDYQIATLRKWAHLVDGFRCDVAPLVPLEFWQAARKAVAEVNPDCIWLAESVEYGFIHYLRGEGIDALSDSEIFQAFDMSYDYDIFETFQAYVEGRGPLSDYLEALNRQESIYPANYVKLHFLENHDRMRAHYVIPDDRDLKNWTAFLYFMKGCTLIYNGQEIGASHRISLFERETIDWSDLGTDQDISTLMARLSKIRRDPVFAQGSFEAHESAPGLVTASLTGEDMTFAGVFAVEGRGGLAKVAVPDGDYENLIDGEMYQVTDGYLSSTGEPVIIKSANKKR
jgi:glycosidase